MPGNFGIVINWSAVPVNDAELQRRLKSATLYHAGGTLAPGDDRALVEQLGGQPGEHDVAIIVKAWEPPLMEFVDFVRALRSAIGDGRMIMVLPVRMDDPQGPGTGDPAQLQIWRRRLASVGDPWLRVDAFHELVSA